MTLIVYNRSHKYNLIKHPTCPGRSSHLLHPSVYLHLDRQLLYIVPWLSSVLSPLRIPTLGHSVQQRFQMEIDPPEGEEGNVLDPED